MIFKIVVGIIAIFLCFSIAYAFTVNVISGPALVTIKGWDRVWTDGKELRIYLSTGTMTVEFIDVRANSVAR